MEFWWHAGKVSFLNFHHILVPQGVPGVPWRRQISVFVRFELRLVANEILPIQAFALGHAQASAVWHLMVVPRGTKKPFPGQILHFLESILEFWWHMGKVDFCTF